MGLRSWGTGRVWAEWRNLATGRLIPGMVISLQLDWMGEIFTEQPDTVFEIDWVKVYPLPL